MAKSMVRGDSPAVTEAKVRVQNAAALDSRALMTAAMRELAALVGAWKARQTGRHYGVPQYILDEVCP